MSLAEKRYAEALIDVAVHNNAVDTFGQELESVINTFEKNPDLKLFILNPVIGSDIKKSSVIDIFNSHIRTEILNLLLLLLDKGKIGYFPAIVSEYARLADESKKALNITITSAVLLDREQIDSIKEKCMLAYNAASVKADVRIDRSLIGGVQVKVNSKIMDGSVKGRLESLKEYLMKG